MLSGRQRLQGRKPAKSASDAVAKKTTFLGKGFRAGHEGRQKTFVERTPTKNTPSKDESDSRKALSKTILDGMRLLAVDE
jgi:hypothetical protein